MPVLVVGKTRIPYTIRRSDRAKRKRIVVTPESVEVVLPKGQTHREAAEFMRDRRRWVFDQRDELQDRMSRMLTFGPERLATGSKIAYRGRRLRLTVETTDLSDLEVKYRNGFHVRKGKSHSEGDVARALRGWLLGRAKKDVAHTVRIYSSKLGFSPNGIRVFDMKRRWGSCGEGGIIQINWRLVLAPRPVMEYAVVHELCHLEHRGHTSSFWRLLRSAIPDYEAPKQWLEKNEDLVEGAFLLGRE